jgi:hypothetical protein
VKSLIISGDPFSGPARIPEFSHRHKAVDDQVPSWGATALSLKMVYDGFVTGGLSPLS